VATHAAKQWQLEEYIQPPKAWAEHRAHGPQATNGLVMQLELLQDTKVLAVVVRNALVVTTDQPRAIVAPSHGPNGVVVGLPHQ
jgi:hypothetical protein